VIHKHLWLDHFKLAITFALPVAPALPVTYFISLFRLNCLVCYCVRIAGCARIAGYEIHKPFSARSLLVTISKLRLLCNAISAPFVLVGVHFSCFGSNAGLAIRGG
jgi:hypothetical protein